MSDHDLKYQYFIADVFTTRPFNGAQIAVFPHADGLNQQQMQLIARELNLSETAFVFAPVDSSGKWRARIFSPHMEIHFAGHPIIAIGYVLACTGDIRLADRYTQFMLEQNIGPIAINITGEAGQPVLVQFSLEIKPVVDRFVPVEAQIANMLSLAETDLENKKFQPLLVYADRAYLIVPIRSYNAVRQAKFNYLAWGQTSVPSSMATDILLFTTQTDTPQSNFHARLVGPNIGINDDPPIGSAMPAFTGYLCAHEHIRQGTHAFVIDRGLASTRKSILNIEMDNRQEDTLTLRVGGPAVMVSSGVMVLPKPD